MGKKKQKKYRNKKTPSRKKISKSAWRPTYDSRQALSLALASHQKGDAHEAANRYQAILDRDPDHPDALHLMGVLMSQQGAYEQAVTLIQKAIRNFPTSEICYTNLGNALAHAGRRGEALDAYRQALTINPDHFDAYNNMGSTIKHMGKPLEAISCFKKALAINPESAEVYSDMGNALAEIGRLDEALACYADALKLNPNYAKAYNNMGSTLKAMERYTEAIDFYCKAVETDPRYAEAFNNLGSTITDIGKPDEALKYFQQALSLNPDFPLAQVNLYYALIRTCNWQRFDLLNKRLDAQTAKALKQNECPLEDPFLNLARHADPAINFSVAQAWSAKIEKNMSEIKTGFSFDGRRDANNKIVLGYLSNNFRNHAMAHLMAGLFKHHDRKHFKVYAYSTGEDDNSEYRKRIQQDCDKFVDIRDINHLDAAQLIYHDKVDILIDLMGYTRGGRVEIAALRPAPIQVRYMGMAGTTGAAFFDYLIADQTVVPKQHSQYYSEKLVYLPDCYQPNDDQQKIADVSFDRKGQGLPEKGFVFCSFNQAFKLDPIMFNVWMSILKEVPDSVLWLQAGSKTAERSLVQEAEACGISAQRLVFGSKMSKAYHLARLKLADLALDTRVVSGAATTSDALWAGVPVVTLKGNHFSSRMSASILNAIGLNDLVTSGLTAYKNLAICLANKPSEIQSVQKRLHNNIKRTPLFNTKIQVANLEGAFRKIWQIYLSGQKAKIIEIG
jgi:protein O-GlcNAc transferase